MELTGSETGLEFIWHIIPTSLNVVRFYVYFEDLPAANSGLFQAINDFLVHSFGVGFHQASGELRTYSYQSGIYAFASSGVAVTTGQWYRIDVKVENDGATKTVDAQVNGVDLAQTAVADANVLHTMRFGSPTAMNATLWYDDFLLSHTEVDYPFGDGYIHPFVAVADGDHNTGGNGWFRRGGGTTPINDTTTNSYELIDHLPVQDAVPVPFEYIEMIANGEDQYVENVIGPADGIPTPTEGPRTVEVLIGHHQNTLGLEIGNSSFRISDGTAEGVVHNQTGAGGDSIRTARNHFASPPGGSDRWTAEEFNNLRHRFGFSTDADPHQYCDFVLVEAEFEGEEPA